MDCGEQSLSWARAGAGPDIHLGAGTGGPAFRRDFTTLAGAPSFAVFEGRGLLTWIQRLGQELVNVPEQPPQL